MLSPLKSSILDPLDTLLLQSLQVVRHRLEHFRRVPDPIRDLTREKDGKVYKVRPMK